MNCRHFDKCSAPFCPLNKESLGGVWYPGLALLLRCPELNLKRPFLIVFLYLPNKGLFL